MKTFTEEQRKQIVYALERQIKTLEDHANRLAAEHDYAAEFPAEDADRLREAIELVKETPYDKPKS